METWLGKRYAWGERGLSPVTAPKAGQVYLTTADPAEGMQAALMVGVQGTGLMVHWLSGSRAGTENVLFGAVFWKPTEKAAQTSIQFAPKGQVSMFGTSGIDWKKNGENSFQGDLARDPQRLASAPMWLNVYLRDRKWVYRIFNDQGDLARKSGFLTAEQAAVAAETHLAKLASKAATPTAYQPWGPDVGSSTRLRARKEPSEPIHQWRQALSLYLAAKRKDKASGVPLQTFWGATLAYLDAFGYGFSADPRFASPLDPSLIQGSLQWWAQQTAGLSPDTEELAAMARAGASKIRQSSRRGPIAWEQIAPFLAVVIRFIVAAEHIPGVHYAQTPAARPAPSKKTSRASRTDPCKPPKQRRGRTAACHGDWDSIQACIKRSGGLRQDAPEAAELVYAAGDRRHVPPGMLRKSGQPWYKLASILTEQGYVRPDPHGRPDEAAALEVVVNAIRGGRRGALPEKNACAAKRAEEQAMAAEVEGRPKKKRRKSSSSHPRNPHGLSSYERQAIEATIQTLGPGEFEVILS